MARVLPLQALHYDPSVVGPLADVAAPPYDVIDATQRAELAARSPYNVVAVDLPQGDGRPDADPYTAAAELFDAWQLQGALVRDRQPAVWAHVQDYTGPDGVRRRRRGFFCRARIEEYGPGRVRPHERTHAGPREDRLRLMHATHADTSPVFSLYPDPEHLAWSALEPATTEAPWGEVEDADGTLHRLWPVRDPEAIAAVRRATRNAELLIADGHHRYETARAYAEDIGGEGEHRYLLMCLVALEDPGLTVFPTHRLPSGLDAAQSERLRDALRRDFEITDVPPEQLAPAAGTGPLQLGYIDAQEQRPLRLVLKDQAIADAAALPGRSKAYRQLGTGVLETLLLKDTLGLTDADISHQRGLRYARTAEQALALVRSGERDVAFLMRPPPVPQVRDVAGAGENTPPKSTYFFPKLLTGLLFNPL